MDEKELREHPLEDAGLPKQAEVREPDEDDEDIPEDHKFRWKDRVGCVEALALEYADNGGRYDLALRAIRLREYAWNVTKMLVKQKNQLRRDAIKRAKDIQHMRDAADVGDIVRVPKLDPNPLLGGYKRDGRKLVEAEIVNKVIISSSIRYTVKRLQDGGIQVGNGHMIKSVVRQSAATS